MTTYFLWWNFHDIRTQHSTLDGDISASREHGRLRGRARLSKILGERSNFSRIHTEDFFWGKKYPARLVELCVSSVSAHPVEKWRSRPTTATQTVCWPSEWRRQSDAPSVSQERKRLDIVIIPSLSSLTNIFPSYRWWQAARLQDICLLQKWNTENFYWQVQRSLGLWMFRGDDGRLYKEFQIRYFWLQVVG